MRSYHYLFFLPVLLLLSGCYKDKGNYDYTDINTLEVNFSPASDTYNAELYTHTYAYRQPATDTMWVTYTPEITQSLTDGDENLRFEWIVTGGGQSAPDTVTAPELRLPFAPKVSTSYVVRFQVMDTNNQVRVYRTLRMRTELPFVKAWFVLHGNPGARMLGAVESPDDGTEAAMIANAYGALHGDANPFQDVQHMFYTAADGEDFRAPEHLTLLEPNKAYYAHPFDLIISPRGYNLMVPDPAARLNLSYGVTNNSIGRYAIIVTDDKKFIHGGPNGFYHYPQTEGDYQLDHAYITPGGHLILWDDSRKRFMYYAFNENWYTWYNGDGRPTGVSNSAVLTPFPEELFHPNEWATKEVYWIGTSMSSTGESTASVITKDRTTGVYWAYGFEVGESWETGEHVITVSRTALTGLDQAPDQHSLFATSVAFDQQFYYTKEETLYHYNLITHENTPVYSLENGQSFTQLKFREPESHYAVTNENHALAMAVLSADGTKGELHEIQFSQAGDVMQQNVFKGEFGPIQDIVFTFIHRIIL